MRLILSLFLILAGISIFLFPTLKEFYHDQKQNDLIEKWEQKTTSSNVSDEVIPEISRKSIQEMEQAFLSESDQENSSKPVETNFTEKDMIGIIEIEKINVKLPILKGANAQVLDVGAGYLEGTAFPGQIGNSAIAAHRSRTYGRMFNRLGEIKVGDEIVIQTDTGTFRYVVYDTVVVKPNELTVLKDKGDRKILTLITCHPIKDPIYRLIVWAELK
jgi:sortase A